jgi:hypothetical protein
METKELNDAIRKINNAVWSLGGFTIVYLIFSSGILTVIHKLL